MTSSYVDKGYVYAVVRVRYAELKLLNSQALDQLVSAGSLDEAIKILKEKGWGQDTGSNDPEVMLQEEREKLWSFVDEIVADRSIFDVFKLPNDYNNLKAALKASVMKFDYPGIYISESTVDPEQIAAAAGAVAWIALEWRLRGKPSLLGLVSGAVAGLVAVTPASGFILPASGAAIGLLSGIACFFMVSIVKTKLGYDDSLDAFGVHGVGGIIGALLTAFFATSDVTGAALPGTGEQLLIQLLSVAATLLYGGLMSAVILFVIKSTVGLRVSEEEETLGLDLALHGERIE